MAPSSKTPPGVLHSRTLQEPQIIRPEHQNESDYVAELTGVNLLRGTPDGRMLELGGGRLVTADAATGPALAVIAPAGVSVCREPRWKEREHLAGTGERGRPDG
jgi:hypothetical protein